MTLQVYLLPCICNLAHTLHGQKFLGKFYLKIEPDLRIILFKKKVVLAAEKNTQFYPYVTLISFYKQLQIRVSPNQANQTKNNTKKTCTLQQEVNLQQIAYVHSLILLRKCACVCKKFLDCTFYVSVGNYSTYVCTLLCMCFACVLHF